MNSKTSLKKYLIERRLYLYEQLQDINEILQTNNFRERDVQKMEILKAQLNEVNEIYEQCLNRNRF